MADPELKKALEEVDTAKGALDESYARMRGTSGMTKGMTPLSQAASPETAMKKWTVKMKDGTVYRGVVAPSAEEASRKMLEGPQGPLAPSWGQQNKPLATPPFTPAKAPERGESVIPDVARGAGALAGGPALGAAALASDIVSPPTQSRDVAGDLVPLGVGALLKPKKTVGSFLSNLGANIVGRGAVEGGIAATQGGKEGDVLSAALGGAAKGVVPGLVQGGVGSALGATKDTLGAQKSLKALRGELSPELAKIIDPSNPSSLLSKTTVRSLTKAAGTNLDKMEAEIAKGLGPDFRFRPMAAAGPGPLSKDEQAIRSILGVRPGEATPYLSKAQGLRPEVQGETFQEIRAKIKELREIGDRQYSVPEMRATAKAAMDDARKLEEGLIAQLPPKLAERYQQAIAQHARDSGAIRWVKGRQAENALAGGVNPIDRPGLAKADEALQKGSIGIKGALHGALGAAEAATGRGIGAAYHLGRAADMTKGGQGPLRPQGRVPNIVPRASGAAAGTGTAALQDWLIKNILGQEPGKNR